jgi:hypothetical protein
MGLFNRKKLVEAVDPSFISVEIDYISEQLSDEGVQLQLMAMTTFIAILFSLRMTSKNRAKGLGGEHVLSIHGLNNVNLFKEVFLSYLNAAILEPILTIGGMETSNTTQIIINLLSLGSICWWIYLITDAFSFEDVTQFFRYHVDLRQEYNEDPKRYPWFKLKDRNEDAEIERSALSGEIRKDVALWFMLACILAAWIPGVVNHRDVLHAYVIVIFWIVLHHYCRQATVWRSNYFVTLLFPSTALMPMEYCLPLMDVADTVDDLAFVESYREFIKERTGIELIIET